MFVPVRPKDPRINRHTVLKRHVRGVQRRPPQRVHVVPRVLDVGVLDNGARHAAVEVDSVGLCGGGHEVCDEEVRRAFGVARLWHPHGHLG